MSLLRRLNVSSKAVELGADATISAFDDVLPLNAIASYTINNGLGTYTITKSGNINTSTTVRWAFRGNYSNYYVRATLISGTAPSGTLNSWLQTNVDRSWSHSTSTSDTTVECVIRIEISNSASGGVILDSHQVTIGATCGLVG